MLILVGIAYLIFTLQVPTSRIGDPQSPKYFPLLIAIFLIVMSVIYFVQTLTKQDVSYTALKSLFERATRRRLLLTCVFIIIYALIFEVVGFFIATLAFLCATLFLINGKRHWFQNICVAVVFSCVAWYTFSHLLDVSLP